MASVAPVKSPNCQNPHQSRISIVTEQKIWKLTKYANRKQGIHPSVLEAYSSCYKSLISILTTILNLVSDYSSLALCRDIIQHHQRRQPRATELLFVQIHIAVSTGVGWHPRSDRVFPIGLILDGHCQMIESLGGLGLNITCRQDGGEAPSGQRTYIK